MPNINHVNKWLDLRKTVCRRQRSLDFPIRFSVAGVGWIPTSSVAQHLNSGFLGFKFKSQPPKPSPKTMKISMKYRAGHNLPTWNQGIKILCPGNCGAFIHQSCFVFLWKSCWCDWALKPMWLVVSFGVRASTFESKEKKETVATPWFTITYVATQLRQTGGWN